DLVTGLRSSHGLHFVPAERGVMRQLVRALRQGEIVGLAVDRDVQGDGVPLSFFGAVTTFQPGAVVLARRLGSPVIAAFTLRRENGFFEGYVEPPLEMVVTEDADHDLVVNLQSILRVMEKYIRAYPEQWVAFEPVWPGEGKLRAEDSAHRESCCFAGQSGHPHP
ncbi:MAG: lysophospholipid acyltransferase family protein, partial [Chloroflexota bacterium]